MKKHISICFLFLGLAFSKVQAQTVYVTEQGKKYHSKNCRLAPKGKKGISLEEAKRLGYHACKICIIDKVHPHKEKQPAKKKTEKK